MDKQEFSQRVLKMEGRLYRISLAMLQNRQDQLDAVQEAVLKAWTNLPRLRNEAFFETWLTRILINECHNVQNLRKRFLPLETAPEPVAPTGDSREIYEALQTLDERLRPVVVLHYMEGYKVREIAQILRIPEGSVKTRLLQARKKLRALMEVE